MSELSTEERLAALKARRARNTDITQPAFPSPAETALSAEQPAPSQLAAAQHNVTQPMPAALTVPAQPTMPAAQTMPADTGIWPAAAAAESWPKAEPQLQAPRWNPTWSWNRVAAGGASIVSFAAMIVAMGPILKTVETNEAGTIEGDSLEATGAVNPAAPPVDIQVDPNSAAAVPPAAALEVTTETVVLAGQPVDGAESAVGAEPAAADAASDPAAGAAPPDAAAPDGAAPAQTPAAPPQTEAPAAAPPQTQAPATAPAQTQAPQAPATAPPQTQAPTTAPPATQAPTTAPPQTQAPTTAPPTTQAPADTPPPRSEGSGG